MNAHADLALFLARETGLAVSRGGVQRSIERFLEQRHRLVGMPGVDAYVRSLMADRGGDLDRLVDAVTVPHSWFYRDAGQWASIEAWLRERVTTRPSVWVPACAAGEDAYTVALVARNLGMEVEVLGSDINTAALARAREGRYGTWSLRGLPAELASRGFSEHAPGQFEVRPEIRARVGFTRHNLMHLPPTAPESDGWDLILCRNVLFYFAQDIADAVVRRLLESLAPRGRLVLGASDILHATPKGARALRITEGTGIVIERIANGPRPSTRPAQPVSRPVRTSSPPPPASAESSSALRAVDADPLDPLARMRAGIELHAAGDVAAAIADFRAALFLDPKLWPAAIYLGVCYERVGRIDDARRVLGAVASLPGDELAVEALPEELHPFADEVLLLARQKLSRHKTWRDSL